MDLFWLPLILLPVLSPLRTAITQPAGPWDDAAQEAEDCHLQAVLLAAAQAGKKNSTEKGFKDVWKESSLLGESPSGDQWLPHSWRRASSPALGTLAAGAVGSWKCLWKPKPAPCQQLRMELHQQETIPPRMVMTAQRLPFATCQPCWWQAPVLHQCCC